MIDITGIDLVKLAQKAYSLSVPQGLGFLPYTPEPLSEEEAKSLVRETSPWSPLDIDYIKGRSIKLCVRREEDGRLTLQDSWYDHTDEQYKELLSSLGIVAPTQEEHNLSCNCISCQKRRKQ